MGILTFRDLQSRPPLEPVERRLETQPRLKPVSVASEKAFAAILSHERRRTDRSGTPFLLMLLNVKRALRAEPAGSILRRLPRALASTIRETDVQGWYSDQVILGVLFTEIRPCGGVSPSDVIESKVRRALAGQLEPKELARIDISLHRYPDDWEGTDGPPEEVDLYPDLAEIRESRKLAQMVKRAIDVAGSLAVLIALSPLLALIALLVRLSSEGPVLFRQGRVGQYGRLFPFLKFRTMYCSNDATLHKKYVQQFIAGGKGDGNSANARDPIYKIKDDPRITPVGRILRRASLDELPQLLNVLRGEMSLVGPRPPIPYEVECYDSWHRRRLLEVKPGITGLWQVCGRSRTKFDDMVRLDLQYARAWSIWLDLKILFRTPRAVISGDGAY